MVAGYTGPVQEAGGQVPGSFCASQPGLRQRQSWSQPHANVHAQSLTGSCDGCLAKTSQIPIMLLDLSCEVQRKQGPSQGVLTRMSPRQLCMMMGSCQKATASQAQGCKDLTQVAAGLRRARQGCTMKISQRRQRLSVSANPPPSTASSTHLQLMED